MGLNKVDMRDIIKAMSEKLAERAAREILHSVELGDKADFQDALVEATKRLTKSREDILYALPELEKLFAPENE